MARNQRFISNRQAQSIASGISCAVQKTIRLPHSRQQKARVHNEKGRSLVTIHGTPRCVAIFQEENPRHSSQCRRMRKVGCDQVSFNPAKPSQPPLRSPARRRCGRSSCDSRSRWSSCFLQKDVESAYCSLQKSDRTCEAKSAASSAASCTTFRLPSNGAKPCRATEHTHAHWHLRCNPSRSPPGSTVPEDIGLEEAVQRYAARAVLWCEVEVIPTAGRTHRSLRGIFED